MKIAERSFKILTEEVGMDPQDIIFDLNILTVATGMEEHNNYAVDFIEAVEEVKKRCPGVRTSGGLSNISFLSAATIRSARPCTPPFCTTALRRVSTWPSSIPVSHELR